MTNQSVPVSSKTGGTLIALMAAAFLVAAGCQMKRNWEFEGHVGHAQGTIVRHDIVWSHRNNHPEVAYRYEVDGVAYQGAAVVTNDDYGQLRAGAAVPLIFLPSTPGDSRIDLEGEKAGQWNYVYGLALIGLPLLAFAALIYSLPRKASHA